MLTVHNLTKIYPGGAKALEGVTLRVDEGEMVAVLGPSGGGKSTLFQCINRLAEPTSGAVRVAGVDVMSLRGKHLARLRRRIGMVFQQYNLAQRLTALENVLAGRIAEAPLWRVLARRFSKRDQDFAIACLERVGMARFADQRAGSLSGGQQQRVAIARALCQEPSLLLADEPVSSLDPESAHQVMDVLSSIHGRDGITVLCSLHQVHLAEAYAPRILGLNGGRLTVDEAGGKIGDETWQLIYGSADRAPIYNRRFFYEYLGREAERCGQENRPVSVLYIEIDPFASILEKHGQIGLDEVVSSIDDIVRDTLRLRREDRLFRADSSVYAAVLPDAGREHARGIGERLRERVKSVKFKEGEVTFSIGVATFPADGESVDALADRAGAALEGAKAAGRDRVGLAAADAPAAAGAG